MDYTEKYLKYKQKYIALKQYAIQQRGGFVAPVLQPQPQPQHVVMLNNPHAIRGQIDPVPFGRQAPPIHFGPQANGQGHNAAMAAIAAAMQGVQNYPQQQQQQSPLEPNIPI